MTVARSRLTLLVAAGLPLVGILGCDGLPSPKSLLAGTWELIPSEPPNPDMKDWLLTFDTAGELTGVSFTLGDRTITWNDPISTTSVDQEELHISVTHIGQTLTFDGTLDSASEPTSADGSLTARVDVGDVAIANSEGDATLVKQ